MADDGFTHNWTVMRDGADVLRQLTAEIDRFTDELENNSEKALATWDGPARAQYQAERLIWNQAITRMWQGLGGGSQALDQVTDNSMRTERRNTDKFVGTGNPGAY